MTRLWSAGQPISVSHDAHGRPQRLYWQGRVHRVETITRQWRVDVSWWRERIWRAYFKLSTDTGLLVEVYQDLLSGAWYLQRLYD
jgi:hypothetical protein